MAPFRASFKSLQHKALMTICRCDACLCVCVYINTHTHIGTRFLPKLPSKMDGRNIHNYHIPPPIIIIGGSSSSEMHTLPSWILLFEKCVMIAQSAICTMPTTSAPQHVPRSKNYVYVYIIYIYTHTQFERGQLCANLAAEYVCVYIYTHTHTISLCLHTPLSSNNYQPTQ